MTEIAYRIFTAAGYEVDYGLMPYRRSIYVQLLSEGIRSMRKSGELDEILSEYGVEDWQ
jgi:hypothetical protein